MADLKHAAAQPSVAAASIHPQPTKPSTATTVMSNASAITDALAGLCAGIFARTLVAPVDRIKLLLQVRSSITTAGSLSSAGRSSAAAITSTASATSSPSSLSPAHPNTNTTKSSSAYQVLKTIVHQEGPASLWRGTVPIILIQAGTSALNFMFMERYKEAAASVMTELEYRYPSLREGGAGGDGSPGDNNGDSSGRKRRFVSSFLSGGLAGATTISILYPLGFMRTRLAVDVGCASRNERTYPRGMRDVVRSIWRTDGVRGFYKGYGIALASVTVYRVVYLGGYDFLKGEMNSNRKTNAEVGRPGQTSGRTPFLHRFLAAQTVSMVASIAYYPLDSIRRRLMMEAGRADAERIYHGSMHCFRRILREEGFKGFYRGIGPDLLRSVGAALVLVSYDEFRNMLFK